MALGLLAANGQIDAARLARLECAGELSLAGELRPVRGALAMALALRQAGGGQELLLPQASAAEAALVDGLVVREARHLLDVVAALQPEGEALPRASALPRQAAAGLPDLSDIKGQAGPKRALEIAAAGGHSLLMSGPPGTGKSMLAQRLAGLLPALDDEAALESAAVLSLAGHFDISRWGQRAFRAPHHSASSVALVGGGCEFQLNMRTHTSKCDCCVALRGSWTLPIRHGNAVLSLRAYPATLVVVADGVKVAPHTPRLKLALTGYSA